ncbi:MAG: phospholipase D-like domain-containing protein [Bacteriovorax sp.]
MGKKTLILSSLLFSLLLSCSDKNLDHFPGTTYPQNGITKNREIIKSGPFVPAQKDFIFQKELDALLVNDLVKVDSLTLYQNKEGKAPLLKMLSDSKKFFFMNFLAFTCDESTEDFVLLLEKRGQAHLDIRLIINKGFSFLDFSCLNRLEKAGVKIVKTKTHSSYAFNDQDELLIGSQSVARMFFKSDGFNSLDRDMMIKASGPLATDALKDFLSQWIEESKDQWEENESLVRFYEARLKSETKALKRGVSLSSGTCRFVSERPKLGVKNIQLLWEKLIENNSRELFFSGTKVDIGEGDIGRMLKAKSLSGMSVNYIGNGLLSGNGELTMVLDEWISNLRGSIFSFMARPLVALRDWDKRRVARDNKNLYEDVMKDSKIHVWTFFNFIHYKVWLFDHPGFFIGSANLDQKKFGVVSDAGIYCMDSTIHDELKAELMRDQKNSVLFQEDK